MALKELTRRSFIKTSGLALLGLSTGITMHRSDNFYYTNYDDTIPESRVEEAMQQTRKNFERIGITTNPVKVPRGIKPEMQGLDSLLIITSEGLGRYPKDYRDPENWRGPPAYAARHGLPQTKCYIEPLLKNLQRVTGHKYTREEMDAHVISIVPNGAVTEQTSVNMEGRALTNLVTHEKGHGYGASHVLSKQDKYFMEISVWGIPNPVFHPRNVVAMKHFIRKTENMTRAEINDYRNNYLKADVDL